MLDTNTVETNMEHFKDRNRAAGASQIAQWVYLLATEASGPSSIPKSSGGKRDLTPASCTLTSKPKSWHLCHKCTYMHEYTHKIITHKLKNKEPLHGHAFMSIYTQ